MDDREDWEEIPNYPNYLVSTHGNVYNMKHNRPLQLHRHSAGYLKVSLYNQDGRREWLVHQLVALCFLDGYREGLRLRHHDTIRDHNHIANLRLVGGRRSLYYSVPSRGLRLRIVETGQVFLNAYACAQFIKGDPSSIYRCLRGERATHLGYHYEYLE